jgi:hypothetical protein
VVHTLGWGVFVRYGEILDGVTWHSASWNASYAGFFTRIFGGSENVPLFEMPRLGWGIVMTLNILTVAGLLWLSAKVSSEPVRRLSDVTFGLTIVVMLLVSPFGWIYYFPLLFLPFVISWREAKALNAPRCRNAIAAAWIMSTVPHILIPAHLNNSAEMWFIWGGSYFYSLIILNSPGFELPEDDNAQP